MKRIKKFMEDFHFVLCSSIDRIVAHNCIFGSWDSLFVLSSVLFLLFLTFAQGMGDRLNQEPFLPEYLLGLVVAIAFGCWIYFAVVRFGRISFFRSGVGQPLWFIPWLLIGIWTFLMPIGLIMDTTASGYEPLNFFDEEHSQQVLVDKLVDNSHFFGHGDSIFRYSDEYAAYSEEDPNSLPFEVQQARSERLEAAAYLGFFRDAKMLAVLSYAYGTWIAFLFLILFVIWAISAVRIYMKLCSNWHEWAFFGCFISCAYQMLLPVLVALGIIPYRNYMPPLAFSSGESLCLFIIPLGAMLGIMKCNNDTL